MRAVVKLPDISQHEELSIRVARGRGVVRGADEAGLRGGNPLPQLTAAARALQTLR